MSVTSSRLRQARPLALLALTLAMAMALLGGQAAAGDSAAAAGSLPCDLYASGGTPCVAAHSTTRALYSAYNGRLYQVKRASDGATRDIGVLGAGGYADAAAQDAFCAGTSCLITVIYDQSGRGNHLTQAPPGGFSGPAAGGYDNLAEASAAPVTVGGHKAYGVFIAPGTGYRNNNTNGIATGDQPEGMYAILDGTHHNGGCCFDYGNAETNSRDTGNGHMEAIYFGNIKVWGYGTGNGPWVMADLENGLFSGSTPATTRATPASATASSPPSSRAARTSGRSGPATPSPAACPRTTADRVPTSPATTRCTRKGPSSSASAATTATAPPAPSTRAS